MSLFPDGMILNAASSPLQDHYLCTVDFEYVGLTAVDSSSIIQFEFIYTRIFKQRQTSYSIEDRSGSRAPDLLAAVWRLKHGILKVHELSLIACRFYLVPSLISIPRSAPSTSSIIATYIHHKNLHTYVGACKFFAERIKFVSQVRRVKGQ